MGVYHGYGLGGNGPAKLYRENNPLLGQVFDAAVMASLDLLQEDELGDLTRYQRDPVRFCREILGVRLWRKQQEIIEDFAHFNRVTVRSCRGAGKTRVAACSVAFVLLCFPKSVIVTTAPTHDQVCNVLWREIHQLVADAPYKLPGKLNETEWEIGPKWFAIGRSTNKPDRFAGYHASPIADSRWDLTDEEFWQMLVPDEAQIKDGGLMVVIVDEASGVEERIFHVVAGFGTTPNYKEMLISNPTQTAGTFFKSHQLSSQDELDAMTEEDRRATDWHRHHISAFDVLKEAPRLMDPGYLARARKDWGEGNPMWEVHVAGNFPSEGPHSLFPFGLLEQMRHREHDFLGNPLKGMERNKDGVLTTRCIFGIDFGASEGQGETVVVIGRGDYILDVIAWSEPDTLVTEERIYDLAARYRPRLVKADSTGIGKSICAHLRIGAPTRPGGKAHTPLPLLAVDFAALPTDPTHYAGKRSELYWQGHLRVREGRLSGLTSEVLKAQLAPQQWAEDTRGKIKVASKDDLVKLNMRWDHADAFVLWGSDDDHGGPVRSGGAAPQAASVRW